MRTVSEAVASTQQGPTAERPTYRLIQVLRAVAALMVVVHHALIMLFERDHLSAPNWIAGSSGVDLFFVISGFVMTISAAPLRAAVHPARTFLARRLERIVPLYWILTTAKVVLLLLAPALALNGLGSAWHIAASYLFLPSLSPEHLFEPVVVVGWTLNFEMAFYALFALALALRWRPLVLLIPVLVGVSALGFVRKPVLLHFLWVHMPTDAWFYVSTVVWEFLFGMVLGVSVRWLRSLPWLLGLGLVMAGFWPLLTWNAPGVSYLRGLLWGVPALAVVSGALILERRWGAASPRWMLELGDASYSIYLSHTFVLPLLAGWIRHWPARWDWHWPAELVTAALVLMCLSAVVGEGVYRGLERPLLLWFKGRRRTAVPANA